MKIEPKSSSYFKRILWGLKGIAVAAVFLTIILFVSDIGKYAFAAAATFAVLFLINFILLVRRCRKQIKTVEITDKNIHLDLLLKDQEIDSIEIGLEYIRIKIQEQFFTFNHWGRNYCLQIDVKRNGIFVKEIEQYEIGGWNLELFKAVYTEYCKAKGLPHNLSSFKRTL